MDMKLPLEILFVEKDWKPIPEELCVRSLEYIKTAEFLENQIWHHFGNYNFEMYNAPDFLVDWCRENLPFDMTGFTVGIQQMLIHDINKHVDGSLRESSFNFVITDDGGVTSWYEAMDNNNIVGSVHYKPRTWYQHQGHVPHRITGIHPPRVAVSIFKDGYNI